MYSTVSIAAYSLYYLWECLLIACKIFESFISIYTIFVIIISLFLSKDLNLDYEGGECIYKHKGFYAEVD